MSYKNVEKPNIDFENAKNELENQNIEENLKNIASEVKEDDNDNSSSKKEAVEILDYEKEDEKEEHIIKLKVPIKSYTEIVFDFENRISRAVLSKIEKEFRTKNKNNRDLIKELDSDYLAMVAAVASNVPYSIIMALNGKDFTRVTSHVRNFLLAD